MIGRDVTRDFLLGANRHTVILERVTEAAFQSIYVDVLVTFTRRPVNYAG